mgnify:CR=1 FL=1
MPLSLTIGATGRHSWLLVDVLEEAAALQAANDDDSTPSAEALRRQDEVASALEAIEADTAYAARADSNPGTLGGRARRAGAARRRERSPRRARRRSRRR